MYPVGYKFARSNQTLAIDTDDLGSEMTYSIQLTPINYTTKSYKSNVCEILNVTNKGFTVVDIGDTISGISYYTAGYITRPTMLKYKLITV